MSLSEPRLYNSTTILDMPHPSAWTTEEVVQKASNVSLGGRDMSDVLYRKYKYKLTWDTIWSTDYNSLVALVDTQYTEYDQLRFTYGKFPTAQSVEVIAKLSERTMVAGSGQDYYSTVTLELVEVNPR